MSDFIRMALDSSGALLEVMSSKNNAIAQMEWEVQGAASMQITVSQFRFFLSFIAAVFAGYGLRMFSSPTSRHVYSTVTGIALVYYPFGSGILQSIFPSVATYLAMLACPSKSGTLTWVLCFPYLIWLHVINASGGNWSAGQLDFTGADMILVLKLISIAMCYQDSWVKDKKKLTAWQAEHAIHRLPSPLEYLSYIFCIGNLLGGPYIEFTVYKEFMELKGIWDPKSAKAQPQPFTRGLLLMFVAFSFMAAHVASTALYGCDAYILIKTSAWYQSLPVMLRWYAIAVCGFFFQFRFYFAWLMSEASLTFAGLNFVGWNEKGAPQWGRVRNADVLGMWFAESGRTVAATWNVQTGVFLRHYVYERLSTHGQKPGFWELLGTQIVSAVWHGLYPGYLMYFLSTVLYMHSSTVVFKLERAYLSPSIPKSFLWRALKVIYTFNTVGYLSSPFIVLSFDKSLAIWADVHFVPWAPIIALLIIQQIVPMKQQRPSRGGAAPLEEKSADQKKGD